MYFCRIDIVEAYYLFFREYHEGIGDEKYRRMCRLKANKKMWYVSPLIDYDYLSQNGKEIYDNLVGKELYKLVAKKLSK